MEKEYLKYALGGLILIIILLLIKYFGFNGGSDVNRNLIESNKPGNMVKSGIDVDDSIKYEIIKSKLELYDFVFAGNANGVREYLINIQSSINQSIEPGFKHPLLAYDSKSLISFLQEVYKKNYGTREQFQSDLQSHDTVFEKDSDMRVNITLPTLSETSGYGTDVDIRPLEAYLVQGKWY